MSTFPFGPVVAPTDFPFGVTAATKTWPYGELPFTHGTGGGLVPPSGFVFLTRVDGTYLTRADGTYLLQRLP